MTTRRIKRTTTSVPTLEGAGVHLNRAFGNMAVLLLDPFLLLDDFRSASPADYQKGFPWHPHRGIETITYVLRGDVAHGDSLGNQGDIGCGDVQWMTAGRGIIHQEMPTGDHDGKLEGFQLWANLPAADKMISPRYRDIKAGQIPTLKLDTGVEIKIIRGEVGGLNGPVIDVMIEPEYLDVTVPANGVFSHPTPENHNVFAYVHAGQGRFDEVTHDLLGNQSLVLDFLYAVRKHQPGAGSAPGWPAKLWHMSSAALPAEKPGPECRKLSATCRQKRYSCLGGLLGPMVQLPQKNGSSI